MAIYEFENLQPLAKKKKKKKKKPYGPTGLQKASMIINRSPKVRGFSRALNLVLDLKVVLKRGRGI